MRAIVLAGGAGARLQPYTHVLPKPLLPVGDTPILEITLRRLALAGFSRVSLAIGHLGHLVEAVIGDGDRFAMTIDYLREKEPLGTAGPLRLADGLAEPFLVMNGDLLTDLNLAAPLTLLRERQVEAVLVAAERRERIDYGVVQNHDGRLTEYVEKPMAEYLVSTGIYALAPSVLELIPAAGRFDLPDLMRELIERRRPVAILPHQGLWMDLGRPADFEEAQEIFRLRRAQLLPNGS